MSSEPYLSVVATSRNDDHGGSLLRRMQIFTNGWIEQCIRHALPAELILVEWNPPPDREPLAQALRWPSDTGPCQVRIITVPPEIHRRYKHSEELPLFQMIAKNVGIRRARAPFILCTNIDILFNDELLSFLASRRLEKGRMYRIDRHDAMSDVPLSASVVDQLEYCRAHLLRVNGRETTFSPGPPLAAFPGATGESDSGIRFGEGFALERRTTGEVFLSAGSEAVMVLPGPTGERRVLRMLVEAGPNPSREVLTLHVRDESGHSLARLPFRSQERVFIPVPPLPSGAPVRELPLRLSVERAGRHPWGPRILNCRLFEWGWASPEELRREMVDCGQEAMKPCSVPAHDIYDYLQGVALHDGWGQRDWMEGQLYRRASDGATFSSYTARRLPGRVVVDLGPEESVSSLEVLVTDDEGRGVVRRRVSGRERIVIPTPSRSKGRRTTFKLGLRGGSARGTAAEARAAQVYGLRRVGFGQSLRALLRPLARPRIDYIHTNGCGDFTLMHREHWFRLRGYPEWEAYSMNIDGFTCYAAHSDGLQELVLGEPKRIYHIEHGLGSGWSPEGEKKLYERIRSKGITWISKEQILEYARRMYRKGPFICNTEAWGLGEEPVVETSPAPAALAIPAGRGPDGTATGSGVDAPTAFYAGKE